MSEDFEVPPESPFALLNSDEQRAWFAYMRLQLRLRYEMNRQLQADSDLSLADYDVLVALTNGRDGRMTMSALATRIGWERSRASHHTKRMTSRGLISTERSALDRRATDVVLTSEGWNALRDAAPGHIGLVKQMFFGGLKPEALEPLSEALEQAYETVISAGTLPRPAELP